MKYLEQSKAEKRKVERWPPETGERGDLCPMGKSFTAAR